jgi:hypothetical protein
MSGITATASTIMAMNQSRLQDQISASLLKMNAQTDQAIVDMLTQNAQQIQILSNNTGGNIDLFV